MNLRRTACRLLAAAFGLCATLPAQAASYTFRSDTYAWESTSTTLTWAGSCTQYPGDDDQATINFTGGFTFRFGGTAYSSVRVLTNGSLQFGTDTGFMRAFTNTALPAAAGPSSGSCANTTPARTMMVYWTDLNPSASGSGGVSWQQKGTAPNRYVVVSWNSVYEYSTTTPYSFQVILYENGEFKYQYGNSNTTGANATIGVQLSSSDTTTYAVDSGYNTIGTAIRWVVPSSTASRVAEYRFDEFGYNGTVGEVADSSGSGHGGVRVGSAASSASGYVCRALDVPANTSTSVSAIDTLLDVDSAIGAAGSIDFWYRGNLTWTSGTPAMLADATMASSRPFYLMRNGGGALRLMVSDSGGGSASVQSANQNFAAGTWVHVAATWKLVNGTNQSTLRLYVNGALAGSTSWTSTGALDAGLGSLFIGDNRSSNTGSSATPNSANGRIDEVRIYNYELTTADIAADMAATHTCPTAVDHYELWLPTASLACQASTVTVTACADSSSPCSNPASSVGGQSATLAASAGTLAATSVSFNASGVASTTLSHPAAADGTVVGVTLSGEQTIATNARRCCPDGAACSAANSCSTTFSTAGFIVSASAGGAAATVPAQTAGNGSGTYYLRAVKSGSSSQACEAALTGSNSVNWAMQCQNPTTCASGNLLTLTGSAASAIAANPASGIGATTPVPMSFDGNGNAPFSFVYADVGQIMLSASKTLNAATLRGTSNSFVVRPASFSVTNVRQTAGPATANPAAASAAGGVFVKAGEAFTATVTALTAGGTATPNFGRETSPEGVVLTPTLVLPAGGSSGTLASATIAGGSFTNGAATPTTLSYSEVGIVTLTPSIADGSYLGAGNVSGGTSGNIGRFVPARFAVSNTSVLHRAGLACSPASTFSYLGENFRLGLTLTAQNLGGATTANYSGSFAKFDPAVASAWQLAGRDGSTTFTTASGRLALGSASGSWSAGVAGGVTLTAAAQRGTAPDGPFGAAFGVAPVDSDGVALGAFDMAALPGGGNDRAMLGTLALRFGRLRLANAMGAADRALALPATLQYWSGSAWDTNTLDSCTRVPSSAVSFGNLRRTLSTADTGVTGALAFVAGQGALTLAAPGGGRSGTADVALSLGSSAADASCLQPWTPGAGDAATAGADLAHLRGAWCGSSWGQDPSARASFGLQRTQDFTIYRRENY